MQFEKEKKNVFFLFLCLLLNSTLRARCSLTQSCHVQDVALEQQQKKTFRFLVAQRHSMMQ